MKQLNLDLMEEDTQLSILFDQKILDELVTLMARAIIKVHRRGGESKDDKPNISE
jgi:uncharacterized protein YqgQ